MIASVPDLLVVAPLLTGDPRAPAPRRRSPATACSSRVGAVAECERQARRGALRIDAGGGVPGPRRRARAPRAARAVAR